MIGDEEIRGAAELERMHAQVLLRADVGEGAAWEAERNRKQTGVDWHFTTADARTKLKRLYPRIQA